MINRYPDTAVIVFQKLAKTTDGLPGSDQDVELEVQGRYEIKDALAEDYKGKFYCNKIDFFRYEGNAEKLKLGSREFEITKVSLHQTHTEIWLK